MKIKAIRKIAAMSLGVVMLLTLAVSLTGCNRNDRATQGNMADWSYDDLEVGDVYAEIRIRGREGVMRFILFEGIAPVGVAEFIKAAESGYYNNRTFHRVLEDILIQGGAFNSDGTDIGVSSDDMFAIEPHANARNFHGALAFAADRHTGQNYRQIYVVTASQSVDVTAQLESLKVAIDRLKEIEEPNAEQREELAELQAMYDRLSSMSPEARERYEELGGYFLLDGTVTVFGQIIDGFDLLREIAGVDVVAGNTSDDVNAGLGGSGQRGRPSRPAEHVFIESVTIVRVAAQSAEE
jgi:cyclophilin family peptidyl-prolyl cis-trans isomerase